MQPQKRVQESKIDMLGSTLYGFYFVCGAIPMERAHEVYRTTRWPAWPAWPAAERKA